MIREPRCGTRPEHLWLLNVPSTKQSTPRAMPAIVFWFGVYSYTEIQVPANEPRHQWSRFRPYDALLRCYATRASERRLAKHYSERHYPWALRTNPEDDTLKNRSVYRSDMSSSEFRTPLVIFSRSIPSHSPRLRQFLHVHSRSNRIGKTSEMERLSYSSKDTIRFLEDGFIIASIRYRC